MGFGRPAPDVAGFLAAAVLLLSFAMLHQPRLAKLIALYAAQAGVLAVACAWQAWVQGAPALLLVAVLTLSAKAVAIPAALRRLARPVASPVGGEASKMTFAYVLIGVGLVALCVALALPIEPTTGAPSRENLALALSVVLFGTLMMVRRGTAPAQVIGLLSMENGLILTVIGVAGTTLLLIGVALAALLLAACAVFGVRAPPLGGRFWMPRLPRPDLRLRAPTE